ncbi:hypothetical protein HY640_03460 [Candidatus Woesearchaeota archaeon]|nr:hypothetical protein [Candidatus Woesearchaeota archaeon]
MPSSKGSLRSLFLMSLCIVVLSAIASVAFSEPKPITVVRNIGVALAVFIIVYFVWLAFHSRYERFFRHRLGR